MDNFDKNLKKDFGKAVWEVRKKYGRKFLKRAQLKEAFELYRGADQNKHDFAELIKLKFFRGNI